MRGRSTAAEDGPEEEQSRKGIKRMRGRRAEYGAEEELRERVEEGSREREEGALRRTCKINGQSARNH
eukprot:3600590-Rhodomonas_salina.1